VTLNLPNFGLMRASQVGARMDAEPTMAPLSDGLGNRGRLILREGRSLPRRSTISPVEHHVVSIQENEHYCCDILNARGCVWLALEHS
jgi:hypothetical protein